MLELSGKLKVRVVCFRLIECYLLESKVVKSGIYSRWPKGSMLKVLVNRSLDQSCSLFEKSLA